MDSTANAEQPHHQTATLEFIENALLFVRLIQASMREALLRAGLIFENWRRWQPYDQRSESTRGGVDGQPAALARGGGARIVLGRMFEDSFAATAQNPRALVAEDGPVRVLLGLD